MIKYICISETQNKKAHQQEKSHWKLHTKKPKTNTTGQQLTCTQRAEGCASVVKHVPTVCEAQSSRLSTVKIGEKKIKLNKPRDVPSENTNKK